ncbi:MAG: phospho-N-acetylmuramoyl-pentapeptide-transferase [Bacteroidales bacterium]|nr:phospho-N-acetylmuramoyl-pentapeptide-transferase [Bacteroidales bacterium]MBR6991681.1 phospho-N-acetylmuramoyl-pentapeptide-transferase [Bacteroidales bacterium]
MLYYLFDWLDRAFDFPGAGVFQYITFRASMSAITSLLIMLFCGKPFIRFIRRKSIGETVRNLGLEGQKEKEGTPTMGGLLILSAIIIPTLLFAKLDNVYVVAMLVTTLWLGLIGFIDDYIKVFRKDKKGMPGRFKVFGQVMLGLGVGLLLSFHPDIASTKTTIPFFKGNEFDYAWLISWMGDWTQNWVWVVYVLVAIFVVTAVSNASNLTDGIDGLATSTASIIGGSLAILAWLSGNIIMANYLNIVYLSNIGELTIFITAFVGATLGFLWFNSFPAEVFMGDTGSLALGGIIAVFALLIRKELLLPILCGIYLVEDFSVICQTWGCKLYRRRHHLPPSQPVPVEHRPFLMTPIHHHYQKQGIPEPKIVQRFAIIGILLAIVSIVTLKLR